MKTAILYVRVSTDEQADRGYSQRDQDERLRIYCQRNNIAIHRVIFEDYSAKTFDRPEWTKLLKELTRTKGKGAECILFTKWDRFSRNTADAYAMIKILKHLNVVPFAIEQPLDTEVPESKVILAIYLAVPEVDNDRRALNTINGMRRAKKEGRWMASAPIGYINKVDETGRKYIAPKEPAASILQWSFEELGKGILGVKQVWKFARAKGLLTTQNNFHKIVRHPVYCGKIVVGAYKDEEKKIVQGQHEPLITEGLFYRVQDIITERISRKVRGITVVANEAIPLRGFLSCPNCGMKLTGSPSKGCRRYYHYYHCNSACGFRVNADKANLLFVEELGKYSLQPGIAEIYKKVVTDIFEQESGSYKIELKHISGQIKDLTERKLRARELLLLGDIDGADYKTIKAECDNKIISLEANLTELKNETPDISAILPVALQNIENLRLKYQEGTISTKYDIISSMYPENLVFDGKIYRTTRLNSIIGLVDGLKVDFRQKKARKSVKNDTPPRWVTWERLELSTH